MILTWIGLTLVAGAAIVAAKWMTSRVDSLGRARSFPWIAVVTLLLVGAGALAPFFLRVRLEARLGEAASSVAGFEVTVRCQSFGEAFVDAGAELGYVKSGPDGVPERATLIKRDACHDLSDYLRSDKMGPSLSQVVAVHTLTHETMHMAGHTNESETEYLAVQRDAEMARRLGAPPDAARRLATLYWEAVYPRMPSGYRTDECRSGGALDRRSPDAPWASVP